MKTVLFDLLSAQPSENTKFHGGGEHIKVVFKKLCDDYLDGVELITFFDKSKFIDDWIIELISKKNIRTYDIRSYQEVNNLPFINDIDVYYDGLLVGINQIKLSRNIKVIGVYHGFRSLENPIDITAPIYETSYKNKVKDWLIILFRRAYLKRKYIETLERINCCTEIVGVSNHSGYAARVFFPHYDKEHIHVFYSPEKNAEKYNGENKYGNQKYILLLGGNRWGKNSYRAIKAIDELFSDGQLPGYTVKVVGGIPYTIRKKIKNVSSFDSLGYLSTEDLEMTYKYCDFFVYPSLNEGFGYPPQEVMKYGKTCVISSVSSLPEIYQTSVYYCNPYDINEIKTRVLQAAENKIPVEIINETYVRIKNRQDRDLDLLCELIVK